MIDFPISFPKAELQMQIERSLEPELMLELAQRNNIDLGVRNTDEILRAFHSYSKSQQDIRRLCGSVLQTEQDYYDLTWAYLHKCKKKNIVHVEPCVYIQEHTIRGLEIGVVIMGIINALDDASEQLDISSHLILCLDYVFGEDDAMYTLEKILPFRNRIVAVGFSHINSAAKDKLTIEKYQTVFNRAVQEGFLTIADISDDDSTANLEQAIHRISASRIVLGTRILNDPALLDWVVGEQIPVTICPSSKTILGNQDVEFERTIVDLLERGVKVTLNISTLNQINVNGFENDSEQQQVKSLSKSMYLQLAQNSLEASFISPTVLQDRLSKFKSN